MRKSPSTMRWHRMRALLRFWAMRRYAS